MNPVQVNHIKIYPFKSRNELIEFVRNKKGLLIAANAEKILNKNILLQKIINQNIAYPDGIGAVLALKRKGYQSIKIPGVELWLDIIAQHYTNKSFYFIGSTQDVIEQTIVKLKKTYPEIDIKNYRNGFIQDNEIPDLILDLIHLKPDIVFVAMGTPKQEFLMNELLSSYPALYQGLGGSFDVFTGKVKRAPKLFLKLKLEWFYRLILQPTRIKRQLKLFSFFLKLLLNKF